MESVLRLIQRTNEDVQEKAREAENAGFLRGEIREVARQIACNELWFQLESDEDLIESCIYQREALNARYRYLLALARKQHVSVAPFQK